MAEVEATAQSRGDIKEPENRISIDETSYLDNMINFEFSLEW